MIVIDYSQTIISNLMAEIGGRTDVDIDINLLRHMVVNTIRSHKQKFGRDYGDIVIACDSRKYWRKEYFPYYKANRKKAREDSGFNWPLIFDSINIIKGELQTFFPYPVIEVEGAEADDIIAALVYWSTRNDLKDEGALFPEPKPFLIISGDHDFNQLQKYKHVKQYSPVQKKFVVPETSPEKYVIEHIIKGDKGDGVPNVLSADDCIVKGERQKKIMSTKLEEWIKDPDTMPKDDNFVRNYQRNRTLVDLSYIPHDIQDKIINTFTECPKKDRSQLLNFFIANKMKQMIEHIGEF
jgi:hypothetical protein